MLLNQGSARPNHKDITHDQRPIDRSIPNHQIVSHQDFGGVREEFSSRLSATWGVRPCTKP
jgi:hypothetical protein